jgi:flavin-dependent dehydrogenase
MPTTDYDVIVVGGGPGGAAAALAAVEGGLNTLLLEKKKMPRHKPCAGLIYDEARRFLNEHYDSLPDEVKANPYHVNKICAYVDKDRNLDIGEKALSIWRDRFDRWLCQESGAEIWNGAELVDFAEWKDHVEVACSRDGKKERLNAGTMIAANGAMSKVARRIDPTFMQGVPCIDSRHEHHRGDIDMEPGAFHVFINAEYGVYPAVYFKDDHVIIDTSVRVGEKLGPTRDNFHRMLQRDFGFKSHELIRHMGCRTAFSSSVNRFCLGTDRVLMAGEAAGFMNALGEGISTAMATGYLAGRAAVEKAGAPPGPLYRESVKPERERTAREWSLPAMLTGRARPELRRALSNLSPLEVLHFTKAMLTWQRKGGISPGLDKSSVEVLLRRLLHRDYDFRT